MTSKMREVEKMRHFRIDLKRCTASHTIEMRTGKKNKEVKTKQNVLRKETLVISVKNHIPCQKLAKVIKFPEGKACKE